MTGQIHPQTDTYYSALILIPTAKLTSIHIVQGSGNTIKVLKEAVIIDMLCVRANTILMAHYPDVRIYLAHSCNSCVRFHFLGRDGDAAVIHTFTQ